MSSDRDRLSLLLGRLRDFELRLALPHERAIVEVAKLVLRDEIGRLAHAMHDLAYTRRPDIEVARAAC
ncbi:MAG TPA: hypothetical protein VK348_03830 [Planctomycetota bacterium]|nr:hypothetical protein [Planctomycetota bacterium]